MYTLVGTDEYQMISRSLISCFRIPRSEIGISDLGIYSISLLVFGVLVFNMT